jgi:hypothetical protein
MSDTWFPPDIDLARAFMPLTTEYLAQVIKFDKWEDNENTQLDKEGMDISLIRDKATIHTIGVRVRRYRSIHNPKIIYHKYDDYTEDDKERDTMTCDWHFYAYLNEKHDNFLSAILFLHDDFIRAKKENKFTTKRYKNKNHSDRWFTCYPFSQIKQYCVHRIWGKIGYLKTPIKPLHGDRDKPKTRREPTTIWTKTSIRANNR